jgi:hypothetical protein
MSVVSTRTYDWQDLADEVITGLYAETGYFVGDDYANAGSPIGWQEWLEWTGNGTTIDGSTGFANLVYTSDEIDLGSDVNFVVTATAITNGTHSIVIKVKPDGGAFADTTVNDTLTGRYVKFEVTVVNASVTASLDSFEASTFTDTISESFNQLDLSTLSGTTASRVLPITRNYNRILSITANSTDSFQIVTTASGGAPAVKGVNLDTWGKIDADTTADITVNGLPAMATDSNGNIKLNP